MSLETELFQLLNKHDYKTGLTVLKQNPNLDINALNEEGGSFFMEAVTDSINKSQERYAFIELLLANPKFQHANKPYTGKTATPAMFAFTDDDPTLAELIVKYKDSKSINVLTYRKKLMYEEQMQSSSGLEKTLASEPDPFFEKMLADRKKVQAILLQDTVHHAIKTDDPTLLQRVVDAGAKLYIPLKDGTFPMDLVKDKPNLKVHQWFTSYIRQHIASDLTLKLAAQNLAAKATAQKQAILQELAKKTVDDIKSTVKFFDYKAEEPAANTAAASSAAKAAGK